MDDNQQQIWQALEKTLIRQEAALRASNWTGFEKAFAEGMAVVDQISRSPTGISQAQLERIRSLYSRLQLMAETHKSQLQGQINAIKRKMDLNDTYRKDRV